MLTFLHVGSLVETGLQYVEEFGEQILVSGGTVFQLYPGAASGVLRERIKRVSGQAKAIQVARNPACFSRCTPSLGDRVPLP